MKTPAASFKLKDVTLSYKGNVALRSINIEVKAGEAVALVGPSGAGKTSLLRLLNGIVRPTQGCVSVDGKCLGKQTPKELRQLRSRIGFVHQDLSLVPNLRVSQNVLAGRLGRMNFFSSLRMMIFPSRKEIEQTYNILKRVGIAEKLFERTSLLSGGQQQRVAIARALFQEPGGLIADEPVSAIDPARAEDTLGLLLSVCRERGLTLCMSLHHLQLARQFVPRLVGMRDGIIVFDKPASEITDKEFKDLYKLERDTRRLDEGI